MQFSVSTMSMPVKCICEVDGLGGGGDGTEEEGMGEVAWHSTKIFVLDSNLHPKHMLFCCKTSFVANYALKLFEIFRLRLLLNFSSEIFVWDFRLRFSSEIFVWDFHLRFSSEIFVWIFFEIFVWDFHRNYLSEIFIWVFVWDFCLRLLSEIVCLRLLSEIFDWRIKLVLCNCANIIL